MIYKEFEIKNQKIPFDPRNKLDYHRRRHMVDYKFKLALFKEHKIEDNPKREKCFELAWSFGHSCGYSEVEIFFDQLVELIK